MAPLQTNQHPAKLFFVGKNSVCVQGVRSNLLENQKSKAIAGHSLRQLWYLLLLLLLLLLPSVAWSSGWNPLPDTGQTICYDIDGNDIDCPASGQPLYGQDAQYQGAAPAYHDNGNHTISNLHNGMMWTNPSDSVQHTWQDAISYCNQLVFADKNDWRLPSKFELESIVDYGRSHPDPAINQVFICQRGFYWSATVHVNNPVYAWSVFSDDGADHWVHKTNNYHIRCVRNER